MTTKERTIIQAAQDPENSLLETAEEEEMKDSSENFLLFPIDRDYFSAWKDTSLLPMAGNPVDFYKMYTLYFKQASRQPQVQTKEKRPLNQVEFALAMGSQVKNGVIKGYKFSKTY